MSHPSSSESPLPALWPVPEGTQEVQTEQWQAVHRGDLTGVQAALAKGAEVSLNRRNRRLRTGPSPSLWCKDDSESLLCGFVMLCSRSDQAKRSGGRQHAGLQPVRLARRLGVIPAQKPACGHSYMPHAIVHSSPQSSFLEIRLGRPERKGLGDDRSVDLSIEDKTRRCGGKIDV